MDWFYTALTVFLKILNIFWTRHFPQVSFIVCHLVVETWKIFAWNLHTYRKIVFWILLFSIIGRVNQHLILFSKPSLKMFPSINIDKIRLTNWSQVWVAENNVWVNDIGRNTTVYKLPALNQCGPLSLVEVQRGSALIGRELHSVAPPVSLMP